MRKFLHERAGIAALAVLALVLTGCNKTGDGSGDLGPLDTSKQVELVLYVVSDEPSGQREMNENFNKLLLEKLNCTLKLNWIGWAEYANKYPLLFSSGEVFDMAYAATWLNFASLAQKGAFKNLDALFPAYAPKNYERQSATALQQGTIDGHLYAVPTLLPTYSAYGPIYRVDINLPGWDGNMNNMADMERYLQIVKDNNPGMEPIQIYSIGSEIDDLFLMENGIYFIKGSTNDFLFIDPTQPNPKLFTWWEYEKAPEFLAMVNRWNQAGYFSKSALSDTDSDKLRNGKAALRIHNIDTWEGDYQMRPEWGLRWNNFTKDLSNMSFTQDALVISSTSKNPERALAFYDLITSDPEAHRAFFYGVQGLSYEIEVVDGEDRIKALNTDRYSSSALWAARTKGLTLSNVGSPPDLQDFKDSFDAAIKDGVNSQKFRSFTIDTSSIETEYAACINVHQQYWWPLELGYTDPVNGLQEYRDKMQAAGIEKVRDTLQKQLDAYVASLN
ncbi:MAG: ABC transporter substrate-binding protein [Spirochaetaceae bacterium]|jgi:putative aldouronate transport system substrate-binding protein|nr:ABC transporter substrate-binding protein [Spirochaetaceae bacterium]